MRWGLDMIGLKNLLIITIDGPHRGSCALKLSTRHPFLNDGILREISATIFLDDQTQVDSKPFGQPEHACLNQCQLIAANRPKLVLWAPPAGGGDIRFLSNVIDARALIGPCSHGTLP